MSAAWARKGIEEWIGRQRCPGSVSGPRQLRLAGTVGRGTRVWPPLCSTLSVLERVCEPPPLLPTTFSILLAHCLGSQIPSQCVPPALLVPHTLEDPCRSIWHPSPAQLGTESCLGRKCQGGGDTGPVGGEAVLCCVCAWGEASSALLLWPAFPQGGVRTRGRQECLGRGQSCAGPGSVATSNCVCGIHQCHLPSERRVWRH